MQYSVIATRLELHYFFTSDTHSLNAFLRNRSEYELLQIIRELSFLLDIQFEIEAEALKEGGLREIWKFIGDNSNQLTVVILLATFILSLVPKHDSALDAVKIQDLKLSIEERKLNIEKLKHELHKLKEDTAEEISYELNKDIKLIKHRSNFYKNLLEDKKIKQISFRALDDNDNIVSPERVVHRNDFKRFILKTDELPPEIDEKAEIEIISPVLKDGNYKWRGIYNGEPISFYMRDKDFKYQVTSGAIQFKSGTILECVLEKLRKIDTLGEIKVTSYSVLTVIKKIDDIAIIETKQGKVYKERQKLKRAQRSLFDDKTKE